MLLKQPQNRNNRQNQLKTQKNPTTVLTFLNILIPMFIKDIILWLEEKHQDKSSPG